MNPMKKSKFKLMIILLSILVLTGVYFIANGMSFYPTFLHRFWEENSDKPYEEFLEEIREEYRKMSVDELLAEMDAVYETGGKSGEDVVIVAPIFAEKAGEITDEKLLTSCEAGNTV